MFVNFVLKSNNDKRVYFKPTCNFVCSNYVPNPNSICRHWFNAVT